MYSSKIRMLVYFLTIMLSISFVISPSAFGQNYKGYAIGYGPLEGETGYPVAIDKDSNGNIAILDALKSTIVIFDNNLQFVRTFPIINYVPPSITNFNFKVSPDGLICLYINNSIIKYSFDGVVVKTYSLQDNRYLSGKPIRLFAPMEGDFIAVKDDLTGEALIVSLSNDKEPILLKGENNRSLFVMDMAVFSNKLCFLSSDQDFSSQSIPTLTIFSYSGIREKSMPLNDYPFMDFPTNVSFDLSGNIVVLGSNLNYAIYNSSLTLIDKISFTQGNAQEYSRYFSGYNQKSILLCNPNTGCHLMQSDGVLKPIAPVVIKDKKMFSPNSICSNKENMFVFDSLLRRINFYQFDNYKSTFPINDLFGIAANQSKISLFQSNSSSFFIVSQGLESRILKKDPATGNSAEIKIPSYISPRSSIYIRSKDNMIYFYSWFDSILYVMPENTDLPVKIQVNKVESTLFSSDCICKVDNNDTIFILLPSLKKMNVFNSSGSLITSFNLSLSYYSSFDFCGDSLAILNNSMCSVEFFSKRGEKLYSIGKKGSILYPKTEKGYSEQSDLLSFPSSLTCYQSTVAVTDTGNSRVVVYEKESESSQIIIELQIGSKSAYVNQKRQDLDVAPFTENGRTLVPFRFIGEALGAKVSWNQDIKKATYELAGTKVEITIGSNIAIVNGKNTIMDVSPKITGGRTFVPLRFVGEALGASVIWEAVTKKIIITYPGK